MIDVVDLKEIPQGIMELGGRIEILSRKNMLSGILPEPFNNIEVRGIWRQEYEVDSQLGRFILYRLAMLVTCVVKDDRDSEITGLQPNLFKKSLCLFRIHINHRMGLYDVKGERIHASEKIEAVSSGSGLEEKRFSAPHMTVERLQSKMDSIHEIEFAIAFFRLIHNRLQGAEPIPLFFRTCFPGYGLSLYVAESAPIHNFSYPCQAKRNSAYFRYNMGGLDRVSRNIIVKSLLNFTHMRFQSVGTTGYRSFFKNGINSSIVIIMNQAVNEVTPATRDCGNSLATQLWLRHFGHNGTTAFTDYAGGACLALSFETGIRLLGIFDGEQCCVDNYVSKVIIYQRRSPSFIEYGDCLTHFALIFSVLPIIVKDTLIRTLSRNGIDYICITDIARQKNPDEPKDVVKSWMRVKNTLEYLGLWESLNNPDFNGIEFDPIMREAGSNSFTMSPSRWIELTGAIGIISKLGREGGTYAQRDIAFKFASWVSVEFELYLVKEFQRLKEEEQKQLGWSAKRELSKLNYRIHTDAIKHNLIPSEITKSQASVIYANEADVLNVAMFGVTAKQWRDANPDLKGNIRDYASINELICLSNMENLNAVFIEQGIPQSERLMKLNQIAIHQMSIFESSDSDRKFLK